MTKYTASPSPMQEHEQALLEQVHTGEVDPYALVLHLQAPVTRQARYYTRYRPDLDWNDLLSCANVAMLERVDVALTRESPFGYLRKVARYRMIDELHACSEHPGGALLSLDRLIGEEGETLSDTLAAADLRLEAPDRKYEAHELVLEPALALLKDTPRTVLIRHYGLGMHAPEPLNVISQRLFPRSPRNAHYQHKRALEKMRLFLTPALSSSHKALAAGE